MYILSNSLFMSLVFIMLRYSLKDFFFLAVYTLSRQSEGCEVHTYIYAVLLYLDLRLTPKPSFLPHFIKISVSLRQG